MGEAETNKTEPQDAPESREEHPLPPASFDYLVSSLRFQAELSLGMYRFGEDKEENKPDLRAAQHAIDLLAMLLEKTRGNLTVEENRFLENSLTELRFRYVQKTEELGRK